MKTDLINKINLGEYVNCYLKTNQIYIENDAFNQNELKLCLTICDDEHINESWAIDLKGVSHYHNLLGIAYMPYFTIDLEDHHPLLWDYHYDSVECELSGTQDLESKQMNELIGELARCYQDNTYGFINLGSNPLLTPIMASNGNPFFSTNQKMIELTEGIFNKYKVHLLNKKIRTGKQKGWAFRPNAKVMLFRNPFIASMTTAFGQAYIVADEISINASNDV
ncbi:MAG: hypothetical protein IPJ54_16835 [Saprospiraceae bacterium]|nr:hypothetical protein [Saprospiraceae bacterium]